MKGIVFVGRSLDVIRKFPVEIKREAGHQLDRVQHGFDPMDWDKECVKFASSKKGSGVLFMSRNSMRQFMFYMLLEKRHKKRQSSILKQLNERLEK